MDDQQREAWRERNRIRADYVQQLMAAQDDNSVAQVLAKFETWAYDRGWNDAMVKIAALADEWKRT